MQTACCVPPLAHSSCHAAPPPHWQGFSTAQKLDKLGMRGSDTCELLFDNCEVPTENVLGQENKVITLMHEGVGRHTPVSIPAQRRASCDAACVARARHSSPAPTEADV